MGRAWVGRSNRACVHGGGGYGRQRTQRGRETAAGGGRCWRAYGAMGLGQTRGGHGSLPALAARHAPHLAGPDAESAGLELAAGQHHAHLVGGQVAGQLQAAAAGARGGGEGLENANANHTARSGMPIPSACTSVQGRRTWCACGTPGVSSILQPVGSRPVTRSMPAGQQADTLVGSAGETGARRPGKHGSWTALSCTAAPDAAPPRPRDAGDAAHPAWCPAAAPW